MGQVVDDNEALSLLLDVIRSGGYIRKHPYLSEIRAEAFRGEMSQCL